MMKAKQYHFLNETNAAIQLQEKLIETLNMINNYVEQFDERSIFSKAAEKRYALEDLIYFFRKVEKTSKLKNEEEFNKKYKTIEFDELNIMNETPEIQCRHCCFFKHDGHKFVCAKELGDKSIPFCSGSKRKDGLDVYFVKIVKKI